MADFESFDDDFFDADEPYDTLVLDAVQEAQRAIWTELDDTASVAFHCQASAGSNPAAQALRIMPLPNEWECPFIAPLILQPGDSQIKIHVLQRNESETSGGFGYNMKVGVGVNPITFSGTHEASAVTAVSGSSSFEWASATIDLKPMNSERFTFVQAWFQGDYDTMWPGDLDPYTDGSYPIVPGMIGPYLGCSWVEDAGAGFGGVGAPYTTDLASQFWVAVDGSDNGLLYRRTARYADGLPTEEGFSGSRTYFGIFPPLDTMGDDAVGWVIQEGNFMEIRAIVVQISRDNGESTSKLFAATDDIIRAGRSPKSATALTQTVADDNLVRRKRLIAMGFPKMMDIVETSTASGVDIPIISTEANSPYTTILPTAFFNGTNGNLGDTTAFETYIPIQSHLQHRKIVMMFMCTGIPTDNPNVEHYGYSADKFGVNFELELMEMSGGNPASFSTQRIATEDVTIKNMSPAQSSYLNFLRYGWGGAEWLTSHLKETDILSFLDKVSLVRIELPELTEGTAYTSDTDRQPHVLRFKMDCDPDGEVQASSVFKAVILGQPTFYTEY